MTIQPVSYQTFPIAEYAARDSYSYSRQIATAPTFGSAAGVEIDSNRVIDILLGQLEQLSYQLTTTRAEAQSEPLFAETRSAEDLGAEVAASAETYSSTEERYNALIDQYAQLRADIEEAGLPESPFAPAGPVAGMLFGIAA